MWRVLLLLLIVDDSYGDHIQYTFHEQNKLNHLTLDRNSGAVYIGGVNRIYQLTPELEVAQWINTGPVNDSVLCAFDCPANYVKSLTDNVNKALVIDYTNNRLITCGSVFQGMCSVRNLNNITHDVREIREAVVANDAIATTVAFIAPGRPDPPITQVLYVGASYTGNSPFRSEVPAVSSRSLDDYHLFNIVANSVTIGTRMFVSKLHQDHYPIQYVYGFSSQGFSYFLTTQLRNVGSETYYSKLVRVCHDDGLYYSYTEIPLSCNEGAGGIDYNLVQAAFVGKSGFTLAKELGITVQDDVLYAAFSQSENKNSNTPSDLSALCVYSLKAIRRKFMENIRTCFSGNVSRGLDFISPPYRCYATKQHNMGEDYCGLDVNTPLGGEQPVEAVPMAVFTKKLTAVAATTTEDYTVLFAGTAQGHLMKIMVKSATSALEYGDIVVEEDSPVNKDLIFDAQQNHLYVMTDHKVSKVKVHQCTEYKSYESCVDAWDPYCGWCSLENKCSIRSECQETADDTNWVPTTPFLTLPSQSYAQSAATKTAGAIELVITTFLIFNAQFLHAFL